MRAGRAPVVIPYLAANPGATVRDMALAFGDCHILLGKALSGLRRQGILKSQKVEGSVLVRWYLQNPDDLGDDFPPCRPVLKSWPSQVAELAASRPWADPFNRTGWASA